MGYSLDHCSQCHSGKLIQTFNSLLCHIFISYTYYSFHNCENKNMILEAIINVYLPNLSSSSEKLTSDLQKLLKRNVGCNADQCSQFFTNKLYHVYLYKYSFNTRELCCTHVHTLIRLTWADQYQIRNIILSDMQPSCKHTTHNKTRDISFPLPENL